MTRAARNHASDSALRTPHSALRSAFSLIEILVTVALLSVIILGLVAMFDQTRRAFTSSLTQVDVLEGGRSAAALIARDLEQLTPTYLSSNNYNFYVDTPNEYLNLLQSLPDPVELRTNTLQEVYFTTRYNQLWAGVGYKLDFAGYDAGVGTLYRFGTNNISAANLGSENNPFPVTAANYLPVQRQYFLNEDPADPTLLGNNNWNRIIDGVVDFRVRAFDRNGKLFAGQRNALGTTVLYPNTGDTNYYYLYAFASNAVPAYVEVELGILETRALERYRALSSNINNPSIARNFLVNHAGQVHVFRQRIAIRGVDPTAYPAQ